MTAARPSWDEYFAGIAEAVAARGDCRKKQVGAVVVRNNRIVATGYNGTPPGGGSCLAGDCPRAFETLIGEGSRSDYSNCIALHAEQNAIACGDRSRMEGGTIYITAEPCDMCAKLIAAAGLKRVVFPPELASLLTGSARLALLFVEIPTEPFRTVPCRLDCKMPAVPGTDLCRYHSGSAGSGSGA